MPFTLYLMRHGIAEEFDPSRMQSDADRRLTAEGRDVLQQQARGVALLGLGVKALFSSPYLRARETGQIIASAFDEPLPFEQTEALVPHAGTDAFLEELRAAGPSDPVLAFSHEPLVSSIVAHVLGDRGAMVDIRRGTLVGLELTRLAPPFRGQLVCLLPPRMQRAPA